MEIVFYISVFGGAALMVYNIVRYFLFFHRMQKMEQYSQNRVVVFVPGIMLILFFVGYILVGIFDSNKDLIVAGILLGGSIFVWLLLIIIFRIVASISEQQQKVERHYAEREREVKELSANALSYFRVNLTKDKILAIGGTDLYETDRVGESYERILEARSPHLVSRFHSVDCRSFHREDLLEYFAAGHDTASEIVLARRLDHTASFVNFKVAMAEEPNSRDVIAFLVEENYNEKMILDTILNRAMSFRYDIVCSIIDGYYDLIASGQQECAKAILPEHELGTYAEFCKEHVLPRLTVDEDSEAIMRALDLSEVSKNLQSQTSYEQDVRIAYQGQVFYKRFTFYKVTTDAEFFVLLVQDTTAIQHERAVQNEKLSSALETARQANAAKTIFFANMSHDIRTPMNAIVGFTELAKQSNDINVVHQYLNKIGSSSDHLLSLINDVLEMSRIESGKASLDPKETNLCDLMFELRDLFQVQMDKKGIEFTISGDGVIHHHVIIDAFRFNRVMLNLISNAYKFTSPGGRVSVTFDEKPLDAEGYSRYAISVKDNGIGMSPEFVQHIFEAYEREKKSTINEIQGTGLGMAITKSTIDLMGGSIEVFTKEGEGSEFIIYLDLPYIDKGDKEKDACCEEDAAAADASAYRFDGMRILLADDNEINREIAEIILQEKGFAVEQAENGKEACDMLFSHPAGYYQLVLMDVQMPVMDGIEAATAIRAYANPDIAAIPVVAFTANAFEEDLMMTKKAGMNAHIVKPINPNEMVEVFASILLGDKKN